MTATAELTKNSVPNEPQPEVLHHSLCDLDSATVDQWRTRGEAVLVDVREPAEHGAVRIPGSILVPLSRFDPSQLPQVEGKTVVLYCRTGNRSSQAAHRLLAAGWDRVFHLDEGIEGWKRDGLPVITEGEAPVSLERQVRVVAGSLVVLLSVLGALISPWFLLGTAAVGAGLVHAGATDTCAMGMILARLPYNQRASTCRR